MARDVPHILISPVKKKTGAEPNLSVANYLAQEFDNDGRVKPVVWGYGDPVFRDAALDGKIAHAGSAPTLQTSLDAAPALDAPYVLLYSTDTKGGALVGHAELYVNGRLKWKNDLQLATKHESDPLVDDAAASMAHSWALLLEGNPLRELAAHPKEVTPSPDPGQAPPAVEVPKPPPQVDQTPATPVTRHRGHGQKSPPQDSNPTTTTPPVSTGPVTVVPIVRGDGRESIADFKSEIETLAKNGKGDQALIRLRDAIDAYPLSPELRLLYVRFLEAQGNIAEAAHQATHAVQLIPDSQALRLAAIKDLLASGQRDQANSELNEILARTPNDPSTMLLQGETYVAVGKPGLALSAFDHLLEVKPSPEAVYWRAVTRVCLGGADGILKDADVYAKAPMKPDDAFEGYISAMDVMASCSRKGFEDTLALFSLAASDARSAQFKARLEDVTRGTEARNAFLSSFPVPDSFKKSNAQRVLAQKLLDVCLADLQDYATSGNDDSATDARINLGEAMKQAKAADDQFAAEKGGKNVEPPAGSG
jgi:tetratricopeptide (TPR) repeat protein